MFIRCYFVCCCLVCFVVISLLIATLTPTLWSYLEIRNQGRNLEISYALSEVSDPSVVFVREHTTLSVTLLYVCIIFIIIDGSLSATGGFAHEASVFYKRLAHHLSTKWGDEYSIVLDWPCCCLCFSLLRSAIQCICGAHSSIGVLSRTPPPMDLVRVESHLT